jgi:GNAT superfamily N-acetyltransferase
MTPKSDLNFQTAKPADAAMIRDLVRAAYARWVPIIGREPRPMNADYDAAIRKHEIEIAYLNADAVGVIEMVLREDHLWIENVAVKPDRQGMGLGRKLLSRAEHRAIETERFEMRLLTNSAFVSSIVLYEKVGYVAIGNEPFMGGTTIYLSKKLGR